jgi:phage terminase Nu1 subunit (DNA packaging protein)
MPSRQRVSQAQYARLRGFSRAYVSRLVRDGVILQVGGKQVDLAQADAALAARREPARPLRRKNAEVHMTAEEGEIQERCLQARAEREMYRAEMEKLKYRVMTGNLIKAEPLFQNVSVQARALRDALLNIPARMAALVAAENDPRRIEAMLHKECEAALAAFFDGPMCAVEQER